MILIIVVLIFFTILFRNWIDRSLKFLSNFFFFMILLYFYQFHQFFRRFSLFT
ncbi:hypothetical protein BY996DRAFT_7220799 [Phakopsora pachyrhizi]|uniref:Expressed protein n=1 Tax=Phakopsora pachyrhizi TaxID=170000 RepID=A0AAV0BEJ1_PHAPC|nr:hypothetical protein BY996DRAFT_7220799 [Phakopsora pachyrhizi]CAH7685666.1 expressed protein [Phakopsora pachyrhizi]